jgi:hypothetical protein
MPGRYAVRNPASHRRTTGFFGGYTSTRVANPSGSVFTWEGAATSEGARGVRLRAAVRLAPRAPWSCRILLLMPGRVKRRRGFTHLSPKRQITLSLAVVQQAGIKIGEELAVETDDFGRVIVSRSASETIGDRRRRALSRAAGALPGVWPAGALDELRNEWR